MITITVLVTNKVTGWDYQDVKALVYMKQETFDRNFKLISSKDLNERIYCFQTLLSTCNLILFEPLILGIILDERKHDSSLIVQKAILHAYSIEKIIA